MSGPLPATNKPETTKPKPNKPKPNKPNRGISDRYDDRGRAETAGQAHPAKVAAERDACTRAVDAAGEQTGPAGDLVTSRPIEDPPIAA